MRESQWTAKVCNEARRRGCISFAVVGHYRQASGWPDRYWAVPGFGGVWLEFKGEHTRLDPLQAYVLKQLRKRGVSAWVIRYPGIVETPDGEQVFRFTQVKELLEWFRSSR